jgi:hypothetical protein
VTTYDPNRSHREYRHTDPATGRIVADTAPMPAWVGAAIPGTDGPAPLTGPWAV